ncbi:MAG: fasciclin domain-containing protein [Gammaproteobacteria bacterium]
MKIFATHRKGLVAAAALAAMSLALLQPAHAGDAPKDIVDTAVAAGSFGTLAAALKAADLVGALKGPGPLTVFAPTDAAFAKLPPGTLENLLKPESREKLKSILLYHVVSGKVMSADIKGEVKPETLEGAKLDIKASAGRITVNGAKVTGADVVASNGVIHVIDTVLLPPG